MKWESFERTTPVGNSKLSIPVKMLFPDSGFILTSYTWYHLFDQSLAISSLRRNQSCDYENNVAEFFIDSNDLISPYLMQVFNDIFISGIYPELWCKGVFYSNSQKG
jgi:hypothetical protein